MQFHIETECKVILLTLYEYFFVKVTYMVSPSLQFSLVNNKKASIKAPLNILFGKLDKYVIKLLL